MLRFTTSQTQQIVDARRPGEGEIAAVGSAAGVHRFAFASRDREDNPVYTVFSTDARPLPADYSFLSLTPYQTTLTVWRSGTVRQFGLSHPLAQAPYSRTGDRLSVSPVTLVGPDGATVTVSGSLVLPMLTLEAGTEQDVERNASADTEEQITFEADGTYRERDGGQAFVGRWEDAGAGRVRILFGSDQIFEQPYRIESGQLRFESISDQCSDDPNRRCRQNYEERFLLVPGSLEQVRLAREVVFRAVGR